MTRRKLLLDDDDDDDFFFSEDAELEKYYLRHYGSKFTRRVLLGVGIMAVVVVIATLLLVFLTPKSNADEPYVSNATMGVFSSAAVVSNGYLCAGIGKDVLAEGGNAVDAAIATLLCDGIMNPQSMGIGGGFLMTIYLRDQKHAISLNARETAPAGADKDMYHGDSNLSQRGALSIAVPGELRGYQEAFEKYGSGKISWERLFIPTIELCEDGFPIPEYIVKTIKTLEDKIKDNPELSEIFINPDTGLLLQPGETVKYLKLGKTMRVLAGAERADAFYNGTLTDAIVKEIQDGGGIITRDDLENYNVVWEEPITSSFFGHKMYSAPLPGSGVVLAFILNLLDILLPAPSETTSIQRIVESFKFAYGRRTELGDFSQSHFVPDVEHIRGLVKNLTSPSYAFGVAKLISDTETHCDPEYYGAVFSEPVDHGTAHLNVLDAYGNAVAVTSTVNLILGSMFVSPSTGILMNDEMDDFSAPNITNAFGLPPSPANFIFPGKRPLSSMCPSIFVDDNGDVQLLAGASGGSTITTTTALMAVQSLAWGNNIKESLDAPRVHHQLFPMRVDYEELLPQDIVNGLRGIGHETNKKVTVGSTATGIARLNNSITGCYDYRRGGAAEGY